MRIHSWLRQRTDSSKVLAARRVRPRLETLEDRTLLNGDYGFGLGLGTSGGDDYGLAVATDGAHVYVGGRFSGPVDFDPGAGVTSLTPVGSPEQVFVAKYSSTGALVWARALGGGSFVKGLGIAVDAAGNVYTTGTFFDTADFDPGPGTSTLTSFGDSDVFVSKLDGAGNFVYARQLGGSSIDTGADVAVDGAGNVYTTGAFLGTADFDPGPGTSTLTGSGGFVSKLDGAGNVVYARRLGGGGGGIAVDGAGNAYTTGGFSGTVDFDPGVGTSNLTSFGGSRDVFVSKLDGAGNFVYARQLGGTSGDGGIDIAVDGAGNVYTTGTFFDTADFDPGPGISNLSGSSFLSLFVSKLDSAGNFVYARKPSGASSTFSWGIAVDGAGNAYTTGWFQGTVDFDPGAGTSYLTSAGFNPDVFVSKLDAAGNFVYARQLGGLGGDFGLDVAVDGSGNVYTTGEFDGTADFDPGAGIRNLTSSGHKDSYVSKLTDAFGNAPPSTPVDNNAAANGVVERAANGASVGIAAFASDANGDTVLYGLTDDAGGRFAIDASSGVVTVADGTLLNFDSATSHSITVQARDGFGDTSTATFTIAVANVAPTVVSLIEDVTAHVNQADTVLDLSGVFADTHGGDLLTLTVSGNSDSALVTASLIGTTLTLDYQPNQSGTAVITVRATDGGGLYVDHAFAVTVLRPEVFDVTPAGDLRSLVVQLNDDDLDTARASDLTNYRLTAAHGDANGDGDPFNDGDEAVLAITAVLYDAAADQLTVQPRDLLLGDSFRLELDGEDATTDGSPGIADLAGAFLLGGDYSTDVDLRNLSGNVTVKVVGGDLVVTGDDRDSEFTIDQDGLAAGQFRIGGAFRYDPGTRPFVTTINGGTGPVVVVGVTNDVRMKLKGGTDGVTLTGVVVPRHLRIDGGAGDNDVGIYSATIGRDVTIENQAGFDLFFLDSSSVVGSVRIDNGRGESGTYFDDGTIGGDVSVENHAGFDDFFLTAFSVAGSVRIHNGPGGSATSIDQGTIGGDLSIENQAGDDEFSLDSSSVAGSVTVHNGEGDSATYAYDVMIGGDLTVESKAGFDDISLEGVSVAGSVKVHAGAGGSFISLYESQVGGSLRIETGQGADWVRLEGVAVTGKTRIATGRDDDLVELLGSTFLDDVKLEGGRGTDTFVNALDNVFAGDLDLDDFEQDDPAPNAVAAGVGTRSPRGARTGGFFVAPSVRCFGDRRCPCGRRSATGPTGFNPSAALWRQAAAGILK